MSLTKPLPPLLCLSLALACACFQSVSAHPAAPGISFSPQVINFGQIPALEPQTQLLTVTFSRAMFPPNHLPALRPLLDSNEPKITLFSRFDGPKTIQVVYRVTFKDYAGSEPFRNILTLVRDQTVSREDAATVAAEDNGVPVTAEVVQGLNADTLSLDFGRLPPGKGATQEFTVGIFRSNFVTQYELSQRRIKPKPGSPPTSPNLWSMSVTSSSPYITAPEHREMGLNGSSWVDWKIVLSPKTPPDALPAELVFKTDNGYTLTVPVYADIRNVAVLEPDPAAKH